MMYLDTNILVYLLEDHGNLSIQVADTLEASSGQLTSSAIAITEFLAGTDAPLSALQQIPKLDFVNLDDIVAENAGHLQRKHKLHIGDSIHLASAISVQATLFFTNDKKLAKIANNYLKTQTL
jgi:predicted nucleic acid-binding protein